MPYNDVLLNLKLSLNEKHEMPEGEISSCARPLVKSERAAHLTEIQPNRKKIRCQSLFPSQANNESYYH